MHTAILSPDRAEKSRCEARGPAQRGRSSGEEASLEKLWVGLGVTSTQENMSVGRRPLLVACRCRRDGQGDWEGMEIWRYRETWAHVHISLVKMLRSLFGFDMRFDYQLLMCIRMEGIM